MFPGLVSSLLLSIEAKIEEFLGRQQSGVRVRALRCLPVSTAGCITSLCLRGPLCEWDRWKQCIHHAGVLRIQWVVCAVCLEQCLGPSKHFFSPSLSHLLSLLLLFFLMCQSLNCLLVCLKEVQWMVSTYHFTSWTFFSWCCFCIMLID